MDRWLPEKTCNNSFQIRITKEYGKRNFYLIKNSKSCQTGDFNPPEVFPSMASNSAGIRAIPKKGEKPDLP